MELRDPTRMATQGTDHGVINIYNQAHLFIKHLSILIHMKLDQDSVKRPCNQRHHRSHTLRHHQHQCITIDVTNPQHHTQRSKGHVFHVAYTDTLPDNAQLPDLMVLHNNRIMLQTRLLILQILTFNQDRFSRMSHKSIAPTCSNNINTPVDKPKACLLIYWAKLMMYKPYFWWTLAAKHVFCHNVLHLNMHVTPRTSSYSQQMVRQYRQQDK